MYGKTSAAIRRVVLIKQHSNGRLKSKVQRGCYNLAPCLKKPAEDFKILVEDFRKLAEDFPNVRRRVKTKAPRLSKFVGWVEE
jgi:hypothetical protein